MTRTPFSFDLRQDDAIRGDLFIPPDAGPSSAVVVCHGFKGFKDWGFFPYLCETIARRTATLVVSFNFSGCGVGEDLQTFTDLDRFGHNTLSREVEDLGEVLDRLARGSIGGEVVPAVSRFGLFGHSRGGAIAILTAAARPDVACTVTWAAVSGLERYAEAFLPQLEADGVAWITNARTGQRLPIWRDLVDDLRDNADELDILAAAGRLEAPLLIVHGDSDETVPLDSAHAIAGAAKSAREVRVVEGAGHTMNAIHPFSGPTPELDRAIDASVGWLSAGLREER